MKRRATGYKRVSSPLGFRTLDQINKAQDAPRKVHRTQSATVKPVFTGLEFARAQKQLEEMKLANLRKEIEEKSKSD